MPKRTNINKVLIIGSGPIIIGQAAEFDYAGTQACIALKEEGCEVILVNNNPATIMTDEQFADRVYFEPLTIESVEEIIRKEKPDGILGTVGGQTGLNLTVNLYEKGILAKYGVEVLGTTPESIMQGEDREAFRALMQELGEPVPESEIIHTVEEAVQFAEKIGFPLIIRPAYTLGGGGGGITSNMEEYVEIVSKGLEASPITQCLIERSIAGFKELEYEMIRDENDTCISICSMENFDPVGVHTGDSIVFAPQQTLSEEEHMALYESAVKIIRALKIVGGCNIQFAQDPHSSQYYLIEVNPRLSRSSALASKAVGYPIAKIAAKLSMGYLLHELINPVTGTTFASLEPTVDYTVVKMPRFPFDKFKTANRKLGTQMKATGEIMAIERHIPAALQKAVRSLELKSIGLELSELTHLTVDELWEIISLQDDRRFFAILQLMRHHVSVEDIHQATKIQVFFLQQLQYLINLEEMAKAETLQTISREQLLELMQNGFSEQWLAYVWGISLQTVRHHLQQVQIKPVFQMVDSCAGEYEAKAPYFYSSYLGAGDEIKPSGKPKIAIIGSGPIRIGQGLEFDYCTVQGALALKKLGFETIMINNNPGTVSTDFQIADRLYFEPLCAEDVLNILEAEKPDGVIVQFGGQTAINLAAILEQFNIPLLGITQEQIDIVEDRERFYDMLQQLNIPHIPGLMAENESNLYVKTKEIGYPLLLRPSYVIGGQGMMIIENESELETVKNSIQYPVLIDAYYRGTELEIDVLSDKDGNIMIPGYFEHIEKAGVHSGDSYAVTPPISVNDDTQKIAYNYAKAIAEKIHFTGLFNIQFVLYENTVYVLEVNPRASRTVPIISKITGYNMIEQCMNILTQNQTVKTFEWDPHYYAIKAPVFSNEKLDGVDPLLAPEMKSTGELVAFGKTVDEALVKSVKWNQQSNRQTKVIALVHSQLDATVSQLLANFKVEYKTVDEVSSSINEWAKAHRGSLFISIDDQSIDAANARKEASSLHMQVITEYHTLQAVLTGSKNETFAPYSLKEWQELNDEKEKVMQ